MLIFFACFNTAYAKAYDFDTTQFTPLFAQHIVKGSCQLHSVTGKRTVTNTHCRNFCKSRLQCGHQFSFQLAINFTAGIISFHVTAHVSVKQNRVGYAIAVFTKATDGDVDIETYVIVNNTERHSTGSTILVAHNFFNVEVVNPLVFTRVAAKGKAFANLTEHVYNAIAQITHEDRRLAGLVINVFARFSAQIYNLALFNDNHCLTFVDCDNGTITDYISFTASVRTSAFAAQTFLSFSNQHVFSQAVTIYKLFPLVAQYATNCTHTSFNKTHSVILLYKNIYIIFNRLTILL